MCLKENGCKESKFKRAECCRCQIPFVQMQGDGQAKSTLHTLEAVCGSPHEPWDCLGTSGAWQGLPWLGFRGGVEQLTQPGGKGRQGPCSLLLTKHSWGASASCVFWGIAVCVLWLLELAGGMGAQ